MKLIESRLDQLFVFDSVEYEFKIFLIAKIIVSKSYGLVPQIAVRRHLMVSDKLGFATGPYAFYAFGKNDNQNSDKTTTEQFQTGIDMQIEYFPTRNLGISAGLFGVYYSTMKFTEADQERFKASSFSAGLTNQLNLRVFYVIGKGSKN